MNRLLLALVALLSLVAVDSAESCQRCGIFGRGCRFAHQVVQQVVAVAEPTPSVQNFVFNNQFPVAGIATALGLPAGNTVYGYSLAASAYTLDPAQVLDRSARLTELAINGGRSALGDHNATVQGALALAADADRRANNTVVALSAITANQQTTGQSQSPVAFKVTVANGRISTEAIDAGGNAQAFGSPACDCQKPASDVPPKPPGAFSAFGAGSLTACAGCHDGSGKKKTPIGFRLDGSEAITREQFDVCESKVKAGEMPPNSSLNLQQRASILAELSKLVRQ